MAKVFEDCLASTYHSCGISEFKAYINPLAIAYRLKRNHFLQVAVWQSKIIGVIEMRNFSHISLLFVAKQYQRQGIGRELVRQAIAICTARDSELTAITVNADPHAVTVYQALGFHAKGQNVINNGICFTPMTYQLSLLPSFAQP